VIRALLVEDEPLALQSLHELLAEVDWIEVVGEARDGRTAVRLIQKLEPDLLFLDVQMPELNGIEVLEEITHRPAVVFTTAYDEHAVTAFELGATDYLVKPFGRKRFEDTLTRVREHLADERWTESAVERAARALREGPVDRIFARKGRKIVPVPVDSVVRIEAGRSYVTLKTAQEDFLLGVTLVDLEARLDPRRFLRVHRSHIVNLDHLVALEPYDDRRLLVRLDDDSSVIASRAGSRVLRSLVA
jgi:two-component system LytT family response regulator